MSDNLDKTGANFLQACDQELIIVLYVELNVRWTAGRNPRAAITTEHWWHERTRNESPFDHLHGSTKHVAQSYSCCVG